MRARLRKSHLKILSIVLIIATVIYFYVKLQPILPTMKTPSSKQTPLTRYLLKSTKAPNKHQKELDLLTDMMKYAWNSYKTHSWGQNELSQGNSNADSLVGAGSSVTIIDAMSTLHLMNLKTEFNLGREHIKKKLDFCKVGSSVSVFEVTIRMIGGLNSAFALTKDPIFLKKSLEVANCVSHAFHTPSGIPSHFIVPNNKNSEPGGTTTLADAGTLDLEFSFLSDVTGLTKYKNLVNKARNSILKANGVQKGERIIGNGVNVNSGQASGQASIAGMGDSFYEYQVKRYVYQKKNTDREIYENFLESVRGSLMIKSGIRLCAVSQGNGHCSMEHLACFAGGMFALASAHSEKYQKSWMEVAANITETCYEAYHQSPIGIGTESFAFANNKLESNSNTMYILRPETVESIFYLFYFTKDEKYRTWGKEILYNLNKRCRTPMGFQGIKINNQRNQPIHDGVQQSFFLAETLKYLYLLFMNHDKLPDLNKWVFNTEAHPIPTHSNKLMKKLLKIGQQLIHSSPVYTTTSNAKKQNSTTTKVNGVSKLPTKNSNN